MGSPRTSLKPGSLPSTKRETRRCQATIDRSAASIKLCATLIRYRISPHCELHLEQQQCSFRAKHSAAEAIPLLRRLLDQGEITGCLLHLVLIVWEKHVINYCPKDYILVEALARFGLPGAAIEWIRQLYTHSQSIVGCNHVDSAPGPLSPCLFVLTLSVIMTDAKWEARGAFARARPIGISFGWVAFADDVVLAMDDTRAAGQLLSAIQVEAARYNLNINNQKARQFTLNGRAQVFYQGRTPVKKVRQVKYLGGCPE